MDDTTFTSTLDIDTEAALRPVRRVEVLTKMAGRRRIWTMEEKLALVGEMERCGNIAALSRERGISTSLLYTWRRELRYAVKANVPMPGGATQRRLRLGQEPAEPAGPGRCAADRAAAAC